MPASFVIKQNAKTALRDKWPRAIAVGAILFAAFCVHLVLFNIFTTMLTGIFSQQVAMFIALAPVILVWQFFGMPVLYGALRWFWFSSIENYVPVSEVFCYFSSGVQYLRATSLSFRIFMRIVGILLACYLPSIILIIARQPATYQLLNFSMPYWVSSLWVLGNVLNVFGTILSVILLLRYFAAPILMINDSSITPQEALDLSVIISKSANGQTFSFLLSFFWWYLLSLFVVPVLYTLPLFMCSYSVYCRFLIHHYNQLATMRNATYFPEYQSGF